MKTRAKILSKVLKSLTPVKRISISEWADLYRILPTTGPAPGKWRNTRAKYLVEVMNAFNDPTVERVVLKSASQIGKSEAMNNIIGYFLHLDPSAIMLTQPTLSDAEDYSKRRISPMLRDCPELKRLIYDDKSAAKMKDSNQTILSKSFLNGASLVLTGANSPAGLASRPIRILLLDEVDRYPASLSEGDPVKIASARTTTFWNRKIGLFSTPTILGESRIDREYLLGTQEVYSHECPNCGWYNELTYEQMVIDSKTVTDEHENKTVFINEVLFRCPSCGFTFTETQMKNARQKYVVNNPDALKNGIRSFFVNGFSSPWISWATICREYLESEDHDESEQVIVNTRFGKSFEKKVVKLELDNLDKRLEKYEAEVPDGVLILTAAVDVQGNRLEYEIVGWKEDRESWGIRRGIIVGSPALKETWDLLDAELDREYSYRDGTKIRVSRTFIDSGYFASKVYEYCRANIKKQRFAIKGRGGIGLPLIIKMRNLTRGVILILLGVNEGKNQIYSMLQTEKAGASYMHFPMNDKLQRNYDETFFDQLTSERLVNHIISGKLVAVYEPLTKHTRNEALDIRVYNLAAFESLYPSIKWEDLRQRRKMEVVQVKKKRRAIVNRSLEL